MNQPNIEQTYCGVLNKMKPEDQALHRAYHDLHYGFPIEKDDELFCRLILEINQAGLSWNTILKKQADFRRAYNNFNIAVVAAYTHTDRERLLQDAGIIRNRLKVDAAIYNAGVILELQQSAGSFKNWLDAQGSLDRAQWTKLFKKTFKFTGGEIVNEFLMSTGYLPGAHHPNCPIYSKTIKAQPAWKRHAKK
jgi:DNA-3-methyladenine glycosylase I